jgi:methionyl-tRNA formyltransferase
MGTPDFAVASLDILVQAGYDVVGVITAPDRPAGRGMKLRPSPVKQYAEEKGLKVLQPVKLKDPAFLAELEALAPDLAVVVAFRMLPSVVWKMPSQGTFNLHGSLLPDYRGAAPLNWAIINGERKSGVTTFLIDEKIDTGNILLQAEVDIPDDWSAGNLHDALMDVGAELVLTTVKGLEAGELKAHAQDDSKALHKAPKIFKEDCEIDWQKESKVVYDFIRGLSPYPAAWTRLNGKTMKIFASEKVEGKEAGNPGQMDFNEKELSLHVSCQDGWLNITQLQLQGKKRMKTEDFLRGYKEELSQFK